MAAATITLGDITAEVRFKDIKNVHLSVLPPAGRVRVSAPSRMKLETVRVYTLSKLNWIRRQQKQLREQARESRREYINRESHWLWGDRYLLKVVERDSPPQLTVRPGKLSLQVRPGADVAKRQQVVDAWYRRELRQAVESLTPIWQKRLGVAVTRIFIARMKTKWGSCNPRLGNIRLNLELAKKPRECLEYILVHEMVHLIEPTHNARFVELMDRAMPQWQGYRDLLNRLPVRHEDWRY